MCYHYMYWNDKDPKRGQHQMLVRIWCNIHLSCSNITHYCMITKSTAFGLIISHKTKSTLTIFQQLYSIFEKIVVTHVHTAPIHRCL